MQQTTTWQIGKKEEENITLWPKQCLFAGFVQSPMNQVAQTFSPHVFRWLVFTPFCSFLLDWLGFDYTFRFCSINWCYIWQQSQSNFVTGGRSYGKGAWRRHCFQVSPKLINFCYMLPHQIKLCLQCTEWKYYRKKKTVLFSTNKFCSESGCSISCPSSLIQISFLNLEWWDLKPPWTFLKHCSALFQY